ncbi:phosphoribosylamine--glycine ligase [Lactobacillus sp. S2-2]|uniref:phosphoribosylamine--glycine ligase n=1 Tax=Lactobacillus sp. S2-2 TaxID=2692917 RepID=UPI001F00BF6E|nr:phosphoribosylamine--glycine ligase [Lactobacillus sp. S2-2]MCF6515052.1 phosphoribosylamine--glycine ligase [Lactobacillus sp. S2-2]
MNKYLLIGSGGREYAIAQKLSEEKDSLVYVAPGNIMMNKIASNVETVDINELDFSNLIIFAKDNKIDLTIVGPEKPLSEGIVDFFEQNKLLIWGPNKYAAQLESSKVFAKQLMKDAKVKTAEYESFNNIEKAFAYINKCIFPIVIKANGLASGKGVVIAEDKEAAIKAINDLFKLPNQTELVIEEYLVGEELSFITMINDDEIVPMPFAQDHKRLLNNDKGPNTGGMGAYSPVPGVNETLKYNAINEIIKPIINQFKIKGNPFKGFLYAGLIKTNDNELKVIEFNVRMGDPETQVILPQLKSDFGKSIIDLLNNKRVKLNWTNHKYYLGSVVASKGYPKQYSNYLKLPKFDKNEMVVYSGVKEQSDEIKSYGGRVLMVVTEDEQLINAQNKVNQVLTETVDTNQYSFRTDIGSKKIKS